MSNKLSRLNVQACIIPIYSLLLLSIFLLYNGNIKAQPLTNFGDSQVVQPAWSPDGTMIAVAQNTYILILSADTLLPVISLKGHNANVSAIAWSPNMTRLATGSSDKTIHVWNTNTWATELIYAKHDEPISAIAWSLDNKQLISTDLQGAGNLHIWDSTTGDLLLTNRSGITDSMLFNPTGTQLVLVGGYILKLKDSLTYDTIAEYRTDALGLSQNEDPTNLMDVVALNPNETQIITGNMGGRVYLWDMASLKPLALLTANPYYVDNPFGVPNPQQSWVLDVTFTPSGRHILAISADGTIKTWDAMSYEEVSTSQIVPVLAAKWSPNCKALILLRTDGTYAIKNTFDLFDTNLVLQG